jgi:hypothetical protein
MLKFLLMPWIIIYSLTSFAMICHPAVSTKNLQYLVGYGSLISEASKKNTLSNVGPNQPVMVKGYARQWNMQAPKKKMTFLGVTPSKTKSFNGIIFKLTPKDISAFDKREIGYCRKKVSYQNIFFLDEASPYNAEYWIYIPKKECAKPYDKAHYPIANYYQQIYLDGCHEIEKKFKVFGFYKQCLKDMPAA